jgi:preprotein translocase subunit YajC
MRISRYILVFLVGFLIAKFWYQKKDNHQQKEEVRVVVNSIKNMSKLVVSSGNFSEVYNFTDSKKYFYETISFDKKAIVTINAKVEVGYDLSKLEIEVDSLAKKIYIHKIPKAAITIIPDVKYFDLQQSQFNAFSKNDLNKINEKSIEKIKQTVELTNLKKEAKTRFFEEISKIYQLSAIYGWEVVDKTNSLFLSDFKEVNLLK